MRILRRRCPKRRNWWESSPMFARVFCQSVPAGSFSADKDACIDWLVVHCPSGDALPSRAAVCSLPNSFFQSDCQSSMQTTLFLLLFGTFSSIKFWIGTERARAAPWRQVSGLLPAEWS
jgi:hypothetical protein